MAHGGTQGNDTHHQIQHKCGPTWRILTLPYKTAKLEFRNMSSKYEECTCKNVFM